MGKEGVHWSALMGHALVASGHRLLLADLQDSFYWLKSLEDP